MTKQLIKKLKASQNKNEMLDTMRVEAKQADESKTITKALKTAIARNIELERAMEQITEIKTSPIKTFQIKSDTTKNEAVAVLMASDWHVDELVKSNEVNGVNAFNLEIAKQRSERFFSSGLKLIDIQRAGVTINKLVLHLGGDFITSDIHDTVNVTLQPTEAILYAQNLICSGIDYLVKNGEFSEITVICNVGNHARLSKEPTTRVEENLEYLLYDNIHNRYNGHNGITVIKPAGYLTYIDIFGLTLRCHHGDNIRYAGGVGGISISLNKAVSQFNTMRHADVDLLGHFHQRYMSSSIVCNSSLIGYNSFAVKIKAVYQPPSQTFFLIDKKHGITISAPIYLEV